MTWNASLNTMNTKFLRRFGKPAIVRHGGTETTLTGIFSSPVQNAAVVSGWDAREPQPSIEFAASEFDATGAGPNDTVVFDGVEYTIAAPPEPDDGGMVKCLLRKYGP